MKLVFFGTPLFAKTILEGLYNSKHSVLAVVTMSDKARERGNKLTKTPVKALAEAHHTLVFEPDRCSNSLFLSELKALNADLFVVAAYGKILPKSLLDIPRFCSINVHGSLLPEYRGAAPIERLIMEGKTTTGITIIQMDEGMDTGDMLGKVKMDLLPDEGALSLRQRMSQKSIPLLLEVMDQIELGEVKKELQNPKHATYASKIQKEDLWLNLNKKNEELVNQVRALDGYGGAKIFLPIGGKPTLCKLFSVKSSDYTFPHLLSLHKDELYLQTKEGSIQVLEIQPEGGKRMDIKTFLRGYSKNLVNS